VSVKLLDNSAFYGYRVRRTVQGKVYQEYFSLKANGQRVNEKRQAQVLAEAEARDHELKELQQVVKASLKSDLAFKPDGSVRGISYLKKNEKSGNVTPIFQLGVSSEISQKIVCTSVSISAYGEDEAWRRVVELYCDHKSIDVGGELYHKLIAAKEATLLKKEAPRSSVNLARVSKQHSERAASYSRPWL